MSETISRVQNMVPERLTSPMIERVAKAIMADDGSPCISILKFNLCKDPDGCICRSLARAAIEAMREPTDQMIWDGGTALHDQQEDSSGIYRAMISAALKEQP